MDSPRRWTYDGSDGWPQYRGLEHYTARTPTTLGTVCTAEAFVVDLDKMSYSKASKVF